MIEDSLRRETRIRAGKGSCPGFKKRDDPAETNSTREMLYGETDSRGCKPLRLFVRKQPEVPSSGY